MPTEEAKRIIEKAIKSPEFVEGLVEASKLVGCIEAVLRNKNAYALESLQGMIDRRIAYLNIQAWFEGLD